jgi:hypothetical protein
VPAGSWDLQIEQGATFDETYTTTEDDGTPVDWTTWTARAQIRAQAAPGSELFLDLTPYLTINGPAITLNIPADATTTLTRTGAWDLELDDGGTPATVIRLLEGKAILSPEVTQ